MKHGNQANTESNRELRDEIASLRGHVTRWQILACLFGVLFIAGGVYANWATATVAELCERNTSLTK